MLGRIVFPQVASPALARKDPTNKHGLDHVDELDFLSIMFWTHVWSPVSSSEGPQVRPLSYQEVSRIGIPDQNSGAVAQLASRGSVM